MIWGWRPQHTQGYTPLCLFYASLDCQLHDVKNIWECFSFIPNPWHLWHLSDFDKQGDQRFQSIQRECPPHFGFFFPFIFICWRLITLQYCSGFCHTLTRISHGFTCAPHPEPRSHLPAGLLRRTPAQTNLASGVPESESKKVPFRIFYTGDISFLFT